MPLKFVFGPSGSGKSTYLYQHVIEESEKNPQENFNSACTGAVYNADTERSGSYASETRNHEY